MYRHTNHPQTQTHPHTNTVKSAKTNNVPHGRAGAWRGLRARSRFLGTCNCKCEERLQNWQPHLKQRKNHQTTRVVTYIGHLRCPPCALVLATEHTLRPYRQEVHLQITKARKRLNLPQLAHGPWSFLCRRALTRGEWKRHASVCSSFLKHSFKSLTHVGNTWLWSEHQSR